MGKEEEGFHEHPWGLTLGPQGLQCIGSIMGTFKGIPLPLPAWTCDDLFFLPRPCAVFGLPKKYTAQRGPEYFYSVATEADVQVKPRRIHEQQLQVVSIPGPSELETAADRTQLLQQANDIWAAGSQLRLGL